MVEKSTPSREVGQRRARMAERRCESSSETSEEVLVNTYAATIACSCQPCEYSTTLETAHEPRRRVSAAKTRSVGVPPELSRTPEASEPMRPRLLARISTLHKLRAEKRPRLSRMRRRNQRRRRLTSISAPFCNKHTSRTPPQNLLAHIRALLSCERPDRRALRARGFHRQGAMSRARDSE